MGGEKVRLKEQPNAEMRCAAPMGVNSDSKEDNEVSGHVYPAMAVGGGAEARKKAVSMMGADQMECVKSSVQSNPEKHGEQVRIEDDGSDALRCGDEQRSRESSYGNQANSVSQRMIQEWVRPGTCEAGYLSPLRIKGAESLSGEKIVRLDLKSHGEAQYMRPEVEGKNTCCGERAESICQERGLAQGTRRKFKRMARDKGKAQESGSAEKAQEVSNKRKALNETLFSFEEFAQKRLCIGEQGGNVTDFTETAVTAEQHRLDK